VRHSEGRHAVAAFVGSKRKQQTGNDLILYILMQLVRDVHVEGSGRLDARLDPRVLRIVGPAYNRRLKAMLLRTSLPRFRLTFCV